MASHISFLDVGHGACAVRFDEAEVALIDAGPGADVLEYLHEEGIDHISTVVITHADADHLGGLIALLGETRFSIGRVVLNSDGAKNTETWRSLVYELDARERMGGLTFDVSLVEGDEPFQAGRMRAEVVAPRRGLAAIGPGGLTESGRPIRTNTISAVVRIVVEGRPIALIASDLDDVGLDQLLDTGHDLRAPVLMYPHHGGRSGAASEQEFAARLLDAVQPETVLFSISRGSHRNPLPEVVQAVRAAGAQIRIACTELSRNCAEAAPTDDPVHLLTLFAHGRPTRSCCGGTFRIDPIPDEWPILPAMESHVAFIHAAAPTALCSP